MRKLLDGDANPRRPMVLFVAELHTHKPAEAAAQAGDAEAAGPQAMAQGQVLEVTLSDGWWGCVAHLDRQLSYFASSPGMGPCGGAEGSSKNPSRRRLRVGDKLFIVGATEGGPSRLPGQDREAKTLRLHVNGTRKARQTARLGWARCRPVLSRAP